MTLQELTSAVITAHFGCKVAKQFNDSYETGSFKPQNFDDLERIKSTVKELLDSDLLDKLEIDDLVSYFEDLKNYLINQ